MLSFFCKHEANSEFLFENSKFNLKRFTWNFQDKRSCGNVFFTKNKTFIFFREVDY